VTSSSPSAKTPAHADRPLYATLARRLVIAIALMILILIPSVILILITGEFAATWASAAAIAGLAAVAAGGVEVAILTSVVMALITPIAIIAGQSPVTGAALMALMCLTVGRMSRFGLHRATLLVPVFMAWMIINPPFWGPKELVVRTDSTYLAWMGVFFLVGAIIPVIVLPFILKKVKLAAPQPHPRQEALPYTITITVLATGATFWILQDPSKWYAGAWLISTILVLSQIGNVGTVRLTIARVVGTTVGSLLVIALVAQVQSMLLIYVIGLVLGVIAIAAKFSPHTWIYFVFITPTVVCLNASSNQHLGDLGKQRAADTLVGAALVLLASAITIGYSHWANNHGAGPTVDEPKIAGESVEPAPA
jgi:hypothetical protein